MAQSVSDECLILSIPVSLFDKCLSYLDSVELKTTFNLCKDIRHYLKNAKFWSDFKVIFKVRKIKPEDLKLPYPENDKQINSDETNNEPLTSTRLPSNRIYNTLNDDALKEEIADDEDEKLDTYQISQSTDALIAKLLTNIIPNFHPNAAINDKHSKSIFHRIYDIDFILKQVQIYQVAVLNTLIWCELLQYFGCWIIDCHLMYSHTFDYLPLFYERGLFREAFDLQADEDQLSTLQNFYDFSVAQLPLMTLLQYAHKNIISLNINCKYYAVRDRFCAQFYTKHNNGLIPDNIDGMSYVCSVSHETLTNKAIDLNMCNINELQQMQMLFENAHTELLVNLLTLKWNKLQHVHFENANLFDLTYYDYANDGMRVNDEINRKCINKIKILDLESCNKLWDSNWFYFMLEGKILNDLVVLRLFHTIWNTKFVIKLPPKLEFLRITEKDERLESDEWDANVSSESDDDDIDSKSIEEKNEHQDTNYVLPKYRNYLSEDIAVHNNNNDNDDDINEVQVKHHSYWNICKWVEDKAQIQTERKWRKYRKPQHGNHLLKLDFSECNALTEIVVDFISLDVFLALFLDINDLNKMRQFVTHQSDLNIHQFLKQYPRKLNIDIIDVLPSLKRIIIVGYSLDKTKLKLFLCVCRKWIVMKNIKIYLPQIDVSVINDLCSKYLIGAGNDGYPIPLNDDEDTEDNDEDLAKYIKQFHTKNENIQSREKMNIKNQRKKEYKYVFKWSEWCNYLFAERLSVQRWSGSENYRLFRRCVNWKMWWFRDVQNRCEPYQNWAFM